MELAPGDRLNARDDHGCFGCGHDNPHGLRLAFYRAPDGTAVWASFTPRREHEGFEGMAHGGIVTTLLDEAMGWAVFARDIWAVTATIEVKFRKPVEVGIETRVIGRVVADRGRAIDLAAQLRRSPDDTMLAEATATFIRVPETKAQAWRDRYLAGPLPPV